MPSFSERMGIKPMNTIILRDSISIELRNGLWSAFKMVYLDDYIKCERSTILSGLWLDYFKYPIDTLPWDWDDVYRDLRKYFFECEWYQVYDFIEFCANNLKNSNQVFVDYCNIILKRELSAYRFIDGILAPVTSEEEIAEIDDALKKSDSIRSVHNHLRRAIELFADKKSPDYRNSIKESISAVEAICGLIIGSEHSTLGDALKEIERKVVIHPALKKAFSALYGYTCNEGGVRHALLDEPTLDFEDAKFMLVSCSAFTNYLLAKSSKAGIDLRKGK